MSELGLAQGKVDLRSAGPVTFGRPGTRCARASRSGLSSAAGSSTRRDSPSRPRPAAVPRRRPRAPPRRSRQLGADGPAGRYFRASAGQLWPPARSRPAHPVPARERSRRPASRRDRADRRRRADMAAGAPSDLGLRRAPAHRRSRTRRPGRQLSQPGVRPRPRLPRSRPLRSEKSSFLTERSGVTPAGQSR
jgi:hypothetical protein